jgi:acyl dehydratase
MLYFEDMAAGRTRRFGTYEVTLEEVLEFARKYDPQPFHLDDEAAAQMHFGRIAASGWHTCSMTMAMLVEQMAIEPTASLGAIGIDNLRWLKPVYPGDVLSCETELLDTARSRSKPHMGRLEMRTTTFNQNGDAVLNMTSLTLIRTRHPEARED